jgi:PAS domain S-box-containing protein
MKELPAYLLAQTLDAVSSSVIITDYRQPGNPIVFVNRAFEAFTGYKREEVIGLNPRFMHGSDRNQSGLNELSSAIAAGRECKVCIRDYRKDKSAYWAEVAVSPIFNEAHEVTHYIGVQTDMTAIEANKLKAQFVSNVTHEVRTPLSGVIGLLEMTLMEEGLQSEIRESLERALEASKELLSVLNSLLDFSRLETGRFELQQEHFSVADLMNGVAKSAGEVAGARGLRFTTVVDKSLPEALLGDIQKIRLILTNLVNNALKFTETGEITVKAEVESLTDRDVKVRFSVADTGIGISHDLQKLFQPFVQADGTLQRRFGGTGLGLSIAKGLVEIMGGKMDVLSAHGCGSTFWFTVTLTRAGNG